MGIGRRNLILLLSQSSGTRFHAPVSYTALGFLLEIQLVLISRKDLQFDGWCNLHSENKNNIHVLSYLTDLHAALMSQRTDMLVQQRVVISLIDAFTE